MLRRRDASDGAGGAGGGSCEIARCARCCVANDAIANDANYIVVTAAAAVRIDVVDDGTMLFLAVLLVLYCVTSAAIYFNSLRISLIGFLQ